MASLRKLRIVRSRFRSSLFGQWYQASIHSILFPMCECWWHHRQCMWDPAYPLDSCVHYHHSSLNRRCVRDTAYIMQGNGPRHPRWYVTFQSWCQSNIKIRWQIWYMNTHIFGKPLVYWERPYSSGGNIVTYSKI
jgi:hypothetical protein